MKVLSIQCYTRFKDSDFIRTPFLCEKEVNEDRSINRIYLAHLTRFDYVMDSIDIQGCSHDQMDTGEIDV